MKFTVEVSKPQITSAFDWQLSQDINVLNEAGEVIAKAELEIITLNKHRGASQSYELLEQQGPTDWEIPLNLYFKGQNVSGALCEKLSIKADTKKAKSHILIEAISVLPTYRNQGVCRFLLQAIAQTHSKAQSITLMSMPLSAFVDPQACEEDQSLAYYQQCDIANDKTTQEDLVAFFTHIGFMPFEVDAEQLAEPLPYDIFVANVQQFTEKK